MLFIIIYTNIIIENDMKVINTFKCMIVIDRRII